MMMFSHIEMCVLMYLILSVRMSMYMAMRMYMGM